MAGDIDGFEGLGEAPRRRRWLWWLIFLLLIFLAGAATMAWTMLRWQQFDAFLHTRFGRTLPVAVTASTAVRAVPAVVAPPPPQAAALAEQMSELSRRLDAIDRRARAASGNADRAEGLLVAFAARRALDRGIGLGYIEALLRDRFGATQPQAVATIISASRAPVTLASLQAELDRAAPNLNGSAGATDWWTAVKREIGGLIVVRRAGEPPSDPADRLGRARRALESGQADVALAEVARIPGNAGAATWFGSARRYIASRAALDRIETAALLEPRAAARPAAASPDELSTDDAAPEVPQLRATGSLPSN